MKSRLNFKPGQRGTTQLVEKYGDSLLYVRYRYDEERGVRVKTVEIVVEEKPWPSPARFGEGEMVKVMVAYSEQALRAMLKAAGGRWNAIDKVWQVRYGTIRGTELECRILDDTRKSTGKCILNKMQRMHPHQDAYIPYKMPAS